MQKLALVGLGASGLFALKELAGADVEVHVFDVGPSTRSDTPARSTRVSSQFAHQKLAATVRRGNLPAAGTTSKSYCRHRQSSADSLFVGQQELQKRLDTIRKTILDHAPCEIPVVSPNGDDLEWIKKKATMAGMVYHYQELLHCGSDNAPAINSSILDEIIDNGPNITFHWDTKVDSVSRKGEQFVVSHSRYRKPGEDEGQDSFDFCILSVGRGGATWLTQQEFYKQLDIHPGQVDIGVRVETSCFFTEEVDKRFYEPKLYYRTKHSNDVVRNFCSNPKGFVTPENHRDYVLVNGHSKMYEKSENNNFAVLVSKTFTRPFKDPQLYSQTIAKIANMLAGGGPLIQRLGDLRAGRRTKSQTTT